MQTQVLKKQEDKNQQSNAKGSSQNKTEQESTLEFFDQRPKTSAQNVVQEKADTSARASKLNFLQKKADVGANSNQPVQLKKFLDIESPIQAKSNSAEQKENKTGLPDGLKSGIESLSGMAMDDVKVHRNSKKPETLQAHAYAQGTSIHVGPGQEKHLPHEAWHVVQQKQGRVKPTVQRAEKVNINDDVALEREATTMGQKAMNFTPQVSNKPLTNASIQTPTAQLWSLPSWMGGASEKAKKYYDEEKGYTVEGDQIIDKKHEGGFLKGAVGGALGTVGGILGGTLGGLWGAGKSIFGKGDIKKDENGQDILDENGKPVRKGFFEQVKSSAFAGGTAGRDMGRVAGAGIVDGTKAIAGGAAGLAVGAAGGVLGAIGGGIVGGVKGAFGHGDRKFTGKKGETNENVKRRGIFEQMWKSGKEGAGFGSKVGFKGGKGVVDGSVGLVEEAPELALNAGRGALGAAGGVVGALGGGIYGGVKGAFGHGDRKFTGKKGETNDTVKRRGALEQMWESGKEGAAFGARKGANSNVTRKVVGGAATMAAAVGGTLLAGPAGGIGAAYAANHANERYWGESNQNADITALAGAAGGGTGGLITSELAGLGSAAALMAAKGGNSAAGMAAGFASKKVGNNFGPDGRPKEAATASTWNLDDVQKPYTLESKAGDQFERIKGLFGFGKKKK
jgi:hypothetical protein